MLRGHATLQSLLGKGNRFPAKKPAKKRQGSEGEATPSSKPSSSRQEQLGKAKHAGRAAGNAADVGGDSEQPQCPVCGRPLSEDVAAVNQHIGLSALVPLNGLQKAYC